MDSKSGTVSPQVYSALLVAVLAAGTAPLAGYCADGVAVTDVRIGLAPEKTRVVFDLSAPAAYALEQFDNPARVVVELIDAAARQPPARMPRIGSPVQEVDVVHTADGRLRYTFFLAQQANTDLFMLKPFKDRGDRLVLDIHSAEEAPAGHAPAATATATENPAAAHGAPAERRAPVDDQKQPQRDLGGYAGEWSGHIRLDSRLFPESPAYSRQDNQNFSLAVRPEYHADWANGEQRISFIPFFRYDANDPKRTNGDIRELYWQLNTGQLSFKAGIDVVFWGVAESQHLVDIINQTDLVEDIDGEEKLGQPMLNLDYMSDLGTWQLYLLPYFRERTFPGPRGRLRSDPPVDMDAATYQSSDENKHLDWALRWSQSIGDWDIGLAHFSGTSREAALLPSNARPEPRLAPFYPQIDQTSLDAQATKGAWLWKLEAIYNRNDYDDYYAYVAGFEFTRFGIADSGSDLGWLLEYHHSDRSRLPTEALLPTNLENDLYLGMRWTGNDIAGTQLLFGILVDMDSQSTFGNLEYRRRLGESWTLGLEARILANIDQADLFYPIRRDSYLGIELTRYY